MPTHVKQYLVIFYEGMLILMARTQQGGLQLQNQHCRVILVKNFSLYASAENKISNEGVKDYRGGDAYM